MEKTIILQIRKIARRGRPPQIRISDMPLTDQVKKADKTAQKIE